MQATKISSDGIIIYNTKSRNHKFNDLQIVANNPHNAASAYYDCGAANLLL